MLTAKELASLKAQDNRRRLTDGGGLFGVVRAAKDGRISVAFTFRYRFGGAHRDLRCGSWPDSTLKEIRAVRDRAKATIASGLDPTLERRAEKAQRDESETAQLVEEERLTVLKLFVSAVSQ